jgi:N-acetylmuramoyl-L-alanine amidase
MKDNMMYTPSPNYNERLNGSVPRVIIVHYTDMISANAALERLCDPGAQVSAHYLIEQSGIVHQMVDDHHRAWHAGKSFWQKEVDLNSLSIGIELDNPGHSHGYPPFPERQIISLTNLLMHLCTLHSIPRFALLGHSDIASMRKSDPGELFPWAYFQSLGFGIPVEKKPLRPIPTTQKDAEDILHGIGYGDASFENILVAFQRHFTPRKITGTLTPATADMLSRIPYLTFFP